MSTKKMEKNELWICLQLKIIKKLIVMKINNIISFLRIGEMKENE